MEAEPNRIIIGIDPGLDGAFAAVGLDSKEVEFLDMPTFNVLVGGKERRQVDSQAVVSWLRGQAFASTEIAVIIEKQQAMPFRGSGKPCPTCKQVKSQGTVSTGTTMMNYGLLLGILAALELPVDLVASRSWKAVMLRDMGSEKEASIMRAKQLVPAVADRLARKKDHGRAEALLIATYGVRQLGVLTDKPF
jgi:hypothetical protein